MADIRIIVDDIRFLARLERELAPETCRYFETLLPYSTKFIHVRWSGEGCWVPLGEQPVPFTFENATSFPAPGQMIFYPGGYSETEILLAYGGVRFASKMGQLAGNHFLTIVEGLDQLPALGKRTLWHGAQDVLIERMP
ncbi:MAG: DUF3830 family protein [Sphingomonadales bacterium]|nr:MAG: DUF3830 family protein [Sphingomonadales bacterium]